MAVSVFGQESRKIVANPAPVYPQLAKRDRLSGTVKVLVTIAPDGHIKDAKVVGGSPNRVLYVLRSILPRIKIPSTEGKEDVVALLDTALSRLPGRRDGLPDLSRPRPAGPRGMNADDAGIFSS